MAGDLMTTAEAFPYTVEVKHREKWTLANVIAGKRSPVWAWWLQCQKAAAEEKKIPLLWFRKNRGDWYLMLPEKDLANHVPNSTKLSLCVSPPKKDIGLQPVLLLASEFLNG